LVEAFTEHEDVIRFALAVSPKKVGFSSSVVAVMARAAYTEDREQITRFASLLDSGITTQKGDDAVIRLRDLVRSGGLGSGRGLKTEVYAKASVALRAFLRGRPLSKLYATGEEVFPLPVKKGAA